MSTEPRAGPEITVAGGGAEEWAPDRAFSASGLMMVSVLPRLKPSGLLDECPGLAAFALARGAACLRLLPLNTGRPAS